MYSDELMAKRLVAVGNTLTEYADNMKVGTYNSHEAWVMSLAEIARFSDLLPEGKSLKSNIEQWMRILKSTFAAREVVSFSDLMYNRSYYEAQSELVVESDIRQIANACLLAANYKE